MDVNQHSDVLSSRIKLLLKAGVIFFMIMAALAWVFVRFSSLGVVSGGEASTLYLYLAIFCNYIFPPCFAVAFGLMLRPFWSNSLKAYIFFLAIQFSFSLVLYGLREQVVHKQQDNLSRSWMASLKFYNFSHLFMDENKDGRIDKAEFLGEGQLYALPQGDYDLDVLLMQGGKPLSGNPVISLRQRIVRGVEKRFKVKFTVDLQPYNDVLKNGPLDVVLVVQKVLVLNATETQVVRWSLFAPFLRSVPWGAPDPLLQPKRIDLDIPQQVDSIQLLAF